MEKKGGNGGGMGYEGGGWRRIKDEIARMEHVERKDYIARM